MDKEPLVSIMMPAYNAGAFIYDAIMSIRNQTYKNWELIIVDDGSEDLTLEMARACADEDARIRVKTIPHGGCPVARNVCIKMCQGKIIARQDADDICSPKRIEKQVNWLLENPDYEIVTCRYSWLKNRITLKQKAEAMIPNLYLAGKGGRPVNATIVCWSEVYDKVKFIPKQEAGSDGDWNFRALNAGFKYGYIPEYLYSQRRHTGQISQRLRGAQAKTHNEALRKYGKLETRQR